MTGSGHRGKDPAERRVRTNLSVRHPLDGPVPDREVDRQTSSSFGVVPRDMRANASIRRTSRNAHQHRLRCSPIAPRPPRSSNGKHGRGDLPRKRDRNSEAVSANEPITAPPIIQEVSARSAMTHRANAHGGFRHTAASSTPVRSMSPAGTGMMRNVTRREHACDRIPRRRISSPVCAVDLNELAAHAQRHAWRAAETPT